jgi:hypothetical protein
LERYNKQQVIIKQIIAVFDNSSTPEPNEEESQKVVDLMQEMQEVNTHSNSSQYGNPPEALMSAMVPGMDGQTDQAPPDCKQM